MHQQLKLNPLDLADCDLVFGPVVKFRGPGRLMRSHLLGMLEPASILQINRHTSRNGAQRMNTGEVIIGELLDVNTKYPFQPGKFLNARADRFISNHGDVAGFQVAYAIAAASLAD